MKKLITLAMVASAAIALAAVGCGGTKCEDAADILAACPGVTTTTTTTTVEATCTETEECQSICTIASADIICDSIDPAKIGDIDATALQTLSDCIADCAGAGSGST